MANDSQEPIEGKVVAPADTSLQMIQSRDHPHYGEVGWLVLDEPKIAATGQHYFKLSNCQHGTAGCYVLETDITKADAKVETERNLTNLTEFDPHKYTDATRDKLVEAFEKMYNVSEACQYVGISRETYYQWIKNIDGLEAIIEEAKAKPLKTAKGVINTALASGDTATAKWLLERKDPDFKPKAEVDNNIGLQETRKKLGDILDERSADDFGEQPAATPEATDGAEVPPSPTDIS